MKWKVKGIDGELDEGAILLEGIYSWRNSVLTVGRGSDDIGRRHYFEVVEMVAIFI